MIIWIAFPKLLKLRMKSYMLYHIQIENNLECLYNGIDIKYTSVNYKFTFWDRYLSRKQLYFISYHTKTI